MGWNGGCIAVGVRAQVRTGVPSVPLVIAMRYATLFPAAPARLVVGLVVLSGASCEDPGSPEPLPPPTITGISPDSLTAGRDSLLVVDGSEFTSASVVRWEGEDRPTEFSPPSLRAQLRPEDVFDPGVFDVTVYNPDPGGGESEPEPVTVVPPEGRNAVVEGAVDDEEGAGVAGVAIRVSDAPEHAEEDGASDSWSDTTETGTDGRYRIHVPAGELEVEALVEGDEDDFITSFEALGSRYDGSHRLAVEEGATATADFAWISCVSAIEYGQAVEMHDAQGCRNVAGEIYRAWSFQGDAGDFVAASVEHLRDDNRLTLRRRSGVIDSISQPYLLTGAGYRRLTSPLPEPGEYFLVLTVPTAEPLVQASTALVRTSKWASVSAGGRHACALDPEGTAWCWGDNVHGQLGDGTTTDRTAPVPVAGDRSFDRIEAGAGHTCGVTRGGDLLCWGRNHAGQVGDGTTAQRTEPTPVAAAGPFRSVSVSVTGAHACSLDSSGEAWCWGDNAHGQLGDGTTTDRLRPTPVAGDGRYRVIAAGGAHTCAATDDGEGRCWGANSRGQLGDGTDRRRLVPTTLARELTLDEMSAGAEHTCGLDLSAGTLGEAILCWGRNDVGQVTVGRATGDQPVPVQPDLSRAFVADWLPPTQTALGSVSLAAQRSCVIAPHREWRRPMFCWGGWDQVLREPPLSFGGFVGGREVGWTSFASISIGGIGDQAFACGIGANEIEEAIYCWGTNASGQLGNGTSNRVLDPQPITARP